MKGKRVLVTGGSGFIASHLVQELLELGATVAVTARYANPVKCERLADIWDKITVIEADLRNRGALQAAQDWKPDITYHMAAYNHVGESFRQVEECFDVNAKGTANLVDVVTSGRIVYMSSSEVYGNQATVPFVETMKPNPESPYAVSKYAGELYCAVKQAQGRDIVIVRAFNTYGPWQSTKAVIPDIVRQCLSGAPVLATSGTQTREFLYVSDTVAGLVQAGLDRSTGVASAINLSTGVEITIRHLIEMIATETNSASELKFGALPTRPNEIMRMCGDNRKAAFLLGWAPRVDLSEGIKRTVAWYRERMGKSTCPVA